MPKDMNSEARLTSGTPRCGRAHRHIGERARSSHATNAARRPPSSERDEHLAARPAVVVAPHEPPDDPEQTGARPARRRAGRASAPRRLSRSRDSASGQQDPDGHVEPEDPLPRSPATTAPPTTGPNATRARRSRPRRRGEPALLRRHGRREEREGQRHHDRAAEALHGTRDVEHLDARCERRRDGRGEDRARSQTDAAARSGRRARPP